MGCVGFIHPLTRERCAWERLDERGTYPLGFPPWLARFARAANVTGDPRHVSAELTVTRTLTCPRQTFIETLLPWYMDLERSYAMLRGSALHEVAARYWPAEWRTETVVRGTLFGQPMSTRVDAMRVDDACVAEIADLKFGLDWSVKWRGKSAKDDHRVQLNEMRLLVGQAPPDGLTCDADAVELTLWDHCAGLETGPAALPAAHMDEAAIAEHRPGGGEYTVRDIVEAHVGALRSINGDRRPGDAAGITCERTLAAPGATCASLPLVGRSMYNGKKCDQYCSVREQCDKLVARYGEPVCATTTT